MGVVYEAYRCLCCGNKKGPIINILMLATIVPLLVMGAIVMLIIGGISYSHVTKYNSVVNDWTSNDYNQFVSLNLSFQVYDGGMYYPAQISTTPDKIQKFGEQKKYSQFFRYEYSGNVLHDFHDTENEALISIFSPTTNATYDVKVRPISYGGCNEYDCYEDEYLEGVVVQVKSDGTIDPTDPITQQIYGPREISIINVTIRSENDPFVFLHDFSKDKWLIGGSPTLLIVFGGIFGGVALMFVFTHIIACIVTKCRGRD